MAIDALLAELERDGRVERDAVLEAARQRAETIKRVAAEHLARHRADWLAPREWALAAAAATAVATARRAARDATLQARQHVFARVIEAVRAGLAAAASSPAFARDLAAHLAEARAFMPDGAIIVECPPDQLAGVRVLVGDASNATIEPVSGMSAGIVVRSGDGAVSVDNTLEARLTRLLPLAAVEIAGALESGA